VNVGRPRILFRADASAEIGIGHVMRCLTLARAAREEGGAPMLVSRCSAGLPHALARKAGVPMMELADDLDAAADADATCEIGRQAGAALVVVDHYGLGEDQWRRMAIESPLVVIDDAGRAEIGNCASIVLNHNVGVDESWYPEAPVVLVGPRYLLVRGAVTAMRPREPRTQHGRVDDVLVTMGGSDPHHGTLVVLDALRSVAGDYRIGVIVGPAFEHAALVEETASRDGRVRLHKGDADFPALLMRADLVVTAGGGTVYECACLGLPALVLQTADNQAGVCSAMARLGAIELVGSVESTTVDELAKRAAELIADGDRRTELSGLGFELVDGRGASRAGRVLVAYALASNETPA